MKKTICLLLCFAICFAFVSCSSDKKEEITEVEQHLSVAPILGVEVEEGDNVGFYALTKNGTYSWTATDENGKTAHTEYDGYFCLDVESLCTFTREQTGGKVTLQPTGSVVDYKTYQAPRAEIESDRTQIINEKYLISNNSPTITFPESGEYYYVVKVNYLQGEVLYGFLLAE